MRDGVDEGVKVERRQVGVFSLDEHYVGSMIPRKKIYKLNNDSKNTY